VHRNELDTSCFEVTDVAGLKSRIKLKFAFSEMKIPRLHRTRDIKLKITFQGLIRQDESFNVVNWLPSMNHVKFVLSSCFYFAYQNSGKPRTPFTAFAS
jgi:hypothetical protein